ncbi:hypothetical protein [Escherichia phage phiWec179]|nr:hypothetical protein [Escherichia phage phiWec179]BDU12332.1 hypothetical protein [Escherichia phage phiWec181]BDU12772.1 hypothetical protein [Escherichia phage phiWec186]
MTKLYVAIDKVDGVESLFLLNDHGVLTMERGFHIDVEDEVRAAKVLEQITPPYLYSPTERMSQFALNPQLIGEWE